MRFYVSPQSLISLVAAIGGFAGSMIGVHSLLRSVFTFVHRHIVLRTSIFGIILFFMPVFLPLGSFGTPQRYGLVLGSSVFAAIWSIALAALFTILIYQKGQDYFKSNAFSLEGVVNNNAVFVSNIVPITIGVFMLAVLLVLFSTIYYRRRTVIGNRPAGGFVHLIVGFLVGLIPFFGLLVVMMAASVGLSIAAPVEQGVYGTAASVAILLAW